MVMFRWMVPEHEAQASIVDTDTPNEQQWQ